MEELLVQPPANQGSCPGLLRPRKKPVTKNLLWMECFAIMAAIVTSKYPEKAPHLLAYARTIVKASQMFEGPAWAAYDSQFCRKAATTKLWDWDIIDSGLYNKCSTGRAKVRSLCHHCLSITHHKQQCPLGTPRAHQIPPTWVSSSIGQSGRAVVELCGLFNSATGNECVGNYRYTHICFLCQLGPHLASTCSKPRKAILGHLPPQG